MENGLQGHELELRVQSRVGKVQKKGDAAEKKKYEWIL
jgi:hypothetical protein